MRRKKTKHKVKVGILGSGTVGEALQEMVFNPNGERSILRDLEIEIVSIYTRHPKDKKWYAQYGKLFTTHPEEVIRHPEAEIIVEVLGSSRESELKTFRDYIIDSFRSGKSVVTSDKSTLVKYGKEIWKAAEEHQQGLRFEACVGGGIPIIRSLCESLAVEKPEAIYGIVNGTCNYILTAMGGQDKSYAEALREAQIKGYAETNPEADTSGRDAEAKLILLAMVTFGLFAERGKLWRRGIEGITSIDFLYANRKGSCTIRHLAVASRQDSGVEAFVSPVLVSRNHFLSNVHGPTNAVFFKGKKSEGSSGQPEKPRDWNYAFVGPGAGGGPTAVAVLGDVCDLARGRIHPFPAPPSLEPPGACSVLSPDQIQAPMYLRFVVQDRAGIVGEICQILGEKGINISEVWQLSHSEEEIMALKKSTGLDNHDEQILPFVITLESAPFGHVQRALDVIRKKDFILLDPVLIPIWSDR